mmetsp:Transcript_42043/g.117064  ORF Transcript_42043/g.117064 Transcript_42043/m.117064 type:complete len:218 (-) Transcript_42043:737-1390(-)
MLSVTSPGVMRGLSACCEDKSQQERRPETCCQKAACERGSADVLHTSVEAIVENAKLLRVASQKALNTSAGAVQAAIWQIGLQVTKHTRRLDAWHPGPQAGGEGGQRGAHRSRGGLLAHASLHLLLPESVALLALVACWLQRITRDRAAARAPVLPRWRHGADQVRHCHRRGPSRGSGGVGGSTTCVGCRVADRGAGNSGRRLVEAPAMRSHAAGSG